MKPVDVPVGQKTKVKINGVDCEVTITPKKVRNPTPFEKTPMLDGFEITLDYKKLLNIEKLEFKVDGKIYDAPTISFGHREMNGNMSDTYELPVCGKKVSIEGTAFDGVETINMPLKIEFESTDSVKTGKIKH